MLGNSASTGVVVAYTANQAAAYWATEVLRNSALRHYVMATEVDDRFPEGQCCPVCGLIDPMVASGEIECPNCRD